MDKSVRFYGRLQTDWGYTIREAMVELGPNLGFNLRPESFICGSES